MCFRRLAAPAVLAIAIVAIAGRAHAWTDARVSAVETTVHLDTLSAPNGDGAATAEATVLAGIVLDVAVLGGQLRALDVSGFTIAGHDDAKHPSVTVLERKDNTPLEDKLHATLARAGRLRRAGHAPLGEAARYEIVFRDPLDRGLYRVAFIARVHLHRLSESHDSFEIEIPPFALGLERVRVHFTSTNAGGWRVSETQKPADSAASFPRSTFERVVMPRLTPWPFTIANLDARPTSAPNGENRPSSGSVESAQTHNTRRVGAAVFLFAIVLSFAAFALDPRRRLVQMPRMLRAVLVLLSAGTFASGCATSVTLAALGSAALFVSLGADVHTRATAGRTRSLLGAGLLVAGAVAAGLSLNPGWKMDELISVAISPFGFVAPWLATLLSTGSLRVESGFADA